MSTEKPKVLMMADWFEPGFRAGGPIRSCVNFAGNLKNDLQIFVLTTDHDLGDTQPYPGITPDTWLPYNDNVKVFYASPGWLSWRSIKNLIRSLQPDVIYLNSMYSRFFSLYPVLMKRAGIIKSKVVLAPRGMLKESAVQFKSSKKNTFLKLYRMAGLQRNIHFHCTDETEQQDVKRYFGNVAFTVLANNPGLQKPLQLPAEKETGSVKLIFIGRIHPIKSLDYLLERLKNVRQKVQLTIVGSNENAAYWNRCKEIIGQLPPNITVHYAGEVAHDKLDEMTMAHHFFVLPTKGENFGHAIFEALTVGRPVIISDQTPWRNLKEYKAGQDIPLSDPKRFESAIEEAAAMSKEQLEEWCRGAWNYRKAYVERSGIKEQYIKLFS
jgi:glycosyltransferase involved in cell wall biosynthesis